MGKRKIHRNIISDSDGAPLLGNMPGWKNIGKLNKQQQVPVRSSH